MRREVTELNRLLHELAQERGYDWIDVNALLAPDGVLLPEMTHDDIHLTADGYLALRTALSPFFQMTGL